MQSDCGSTLSNRSSNDTGLKPGEFYIFNNDLVIGTYLQIWSNKDEKETKALQFWQNETNFDNITPVKYIILEFTKKGELL